MFLLIDRKEHKEKLSPLLVWNQAEPDISMGTCFFNKSQICDLV